MIGVVLYFFIIPAEKPPQGVPSLKEALSAPKVKCRHSNGFVECHTPTFSGKRPVGETGTCLVPVTPAVFAMAASGFCLLILTLVLLISFPIYLFSPNLERSNKAGVVGFP